MDEIRVEKYELVENRKKFSNTGQLDFVPSEFGAAERETGERGEWI